MRVFTPALFTVAKLETNYIVHQPRDGMALDTGGFPFSPKQERNCVTCKKTMHLELSRSVGLRKTGITGTRSLVGLRFHIGTKGEDMKEKG